MFCETYHMFDSMLLALRKLKNESIHKNCRVILDLFSDNQTIWLLTLRDGTGRKLSDLSDDFGVRQLFCRTILELFCLTSNNYLTDCFPSPTWRHLTFTLLSHGWLAAHETWSLLLMWWFWVDIQSSLLRFELVFNIVAWDHLTLFLPLHL